MEAVVKKSTDEEKNVRREIWRRITCGSRAQLQKNLRTKKNRPRTKSIMKNDYSSRHETKTKLEEDPQSLMAFKRPPGT